MQGKVKWFNSKKGYGFLASNDGGADIFVHYSAIQASGYRSLHEGDLVEFSTVESPKGPQAENVTVIESKVKGVDNERSVSRA